MSSIFDKMNPWFQPYDMYASGANAFLAGFYGGYKLTIAFEYLLRGLRRLLLRCCNRPDRTGELIDTAVIQANLSNQLEAYREDPALHTVSGAALATDMTRRNRIYLTASRSDVADEAASLLDNDAADDHLDSDGASVGDSRDAEAPRHLPTASPWRHRGITAARWLLGHAPMQFCMIVSVVSWFLYTADQMHEDIQKIPHLDNDYAKYGLSFAAFISPAFQYIYFTFDLTNSLLNIIGNLLKRQPISTLSKALMAPFLVLTPIYLLAAYISSNTALDLNDDYDLNALWFTIATLIGGTVANGYTLFALTSDALNTLNDHLFFTPQQRRANNAVKESLEFIEYSAKAA